MRIIVDLQACQTAGSAHRGVGRYSSALFDGLIRHAGSRDIRAVTSSTLPHGADVSLLSESSVTRLPALPDWRTGRGYAGGQQDSLDGLAYSSLIANASADIVHVSHVFEGFGDRVALPSLRQRAAGQVLSATLYDLIPLIFKDFYFQNEEFRKWYFARLGWLRQADLLLAISESSRQDAINLLGLEPWRIVTIHGGISSHFRPPEDRKAVKRAMVERYKLRSRFVLYTGGDDHRKNIAGAISGYAEIPEKLRRDCQLVIVCSMEEARKRMYLDIARRSGLIGSDVLITGFVPEEDLVNLYQACDAFVFPSLYEGLGLPVLEAMACGAPVVGGNNSSVRELIARQDAMFDASSPLSIGKTLSEVLTKKNYADELRRYGVERARDFSWDTSAERALEAFDEASARARHIGMKAASDGWLPRKRLAVLTPLPPCRSGIADFNAKFLPYLARHFDIDLYVDNYAVGDEYLGANFRIFNVTEFENVAGNYDHILYEFGNSEFHYHMLPLLEKFPGVVGLHDAFLSGLFGYLDFHLGQSGRYAQEMLKAHGPRARRFFAPVRRHPEPNGGTMVALPCTKHVLDKATGIISHSPFNLQVAQENHPEGWPAPYRIIPQMVPLVEAWPEEVVVAAKRELGFESDDIIIGTFGHIAWTKWGDRLLEAFLASPLAKDQRVHLVFAGELAKDDFGRRLEQSIQRSGKERRIHVTGFLAEDAYAKYLQISVLAVQLRTMSRGGTPKGVLDCLACGLPVVVNNAASYTDYPDRVVHKLSAEPDIEEISRTLTALVGDTEARLELARAGREYVRSHHDPAQCAAAYAAAIHEFSERAQLIEPDHKARGFAPYLASCSDVAVVTKTAANWLDSIPSSRWERRRLFIDVSHIAQMDHETGIQRVVKEIVSAIYCSERAGFDPVAVELIDGSLRPAKNWLVQKGLLVGRELSENDALEAVLFRAGDVLLMLDSSWARYREFFPVFESARIVRVPIYTAIYDILPMLLPKGNFVDGGSEWFTSWFNDAITVSDGLVCISKAVAEDVLGQLHARADLQKRPKVGYWHLGADFAPAANAGEPAVNVSSLAKRSFLLMVGTIEPRKSHALALDALELLWEKGVELSLCIAGKEGWMVGELMERLRNHPMAGKRLFLFEGPSDVDIRFLYNNASALLFLSKGEGFGLPLVEAANFGTPIVCSDIPVFHEIAGDFATYVRLGDASSVAVELEAWWRQRKSGKIADTRLMPRLTWEQSADALLKVVLDNQWLRSSK